MVAVVSNKYDFKELALIPILHPILKWENTRPAQLNNEGQEFLRTIRVDASNQHANQNNAPHNQSECLNLAFSGIKCNAKLWLHIRILANLCPFKPCTKMDFSFMEHKRRSLRECSHCSFPFRESGGPVAIKLQKEQKS